ncbi:MAG: hypothetical protein HRU05_20470 [Oceanospirillaceae bacterium]|nr:hypothetical protein [Oceanospirillaceae bacterium]
MAIISVMDGELLQDSAQATLAAIRAENHSLEDIHVGRDVGSGSAEKIICIGQNDSDSVA